MSTKSRLLLGKILVGVGLLIFAGLIVVRVHAASQGQLKSFDEYGKRVVVPFLGTASLGAGIFILALSGGNREDT